MASTEAIEAVHRNTCANDRVGSLQVRAWLKRWNMPEEWAAAGFGAFDCDHRVNPNTVGRCRACQGTEALFTRLMFSLELMEPPVYAHDEHMMLSAERLMQGILLSSDKEWTAWRKKSAKKKGALEGTWLKKLQPLRTFLMESDAGELCTETGPFRNMIIQVTEAMIQSAGQQVMGDR
jgi:hypothetical protein